MGWSHLPTIEISRIAGWVFIVTPWLGNEHYTGFCGLCNRFCGLSDKSPVGKLISEVAEQGLDRLAGILGSGLPRLGDKERLGGKLCMTKE